MAWCLTAPRHYLNQCWLIINAFLWQSPESNFTVSAQDIKLSIEFEIHIFKNKNTSLMGHWINMLLPPPPPPPPPTLLHQNKHCPLPRWSCSCQYNYNDVIMDTMASQITGVSFVCPTVCSGTDQMKHQSSASLAFVRGIHRWIPSAQMASNAENASIWWRHHGKLGHFYVTFRGVARRRQRGPGLNFKMSKMWKLPRRK